MLRWLILAALAAMAVADDCCSAEDRKELQFLWRQVWSSAYTDRRVALVGAIFDDMFHRYPEAKNLFKRVKVDEPASGEWRGHLVRVANGLDNIFNLMSDPAVLVQQLNHLADQHVARDGVQARYFKAMQDAFNHVLPQVSSCFNLEAFNRCFTKATDYITAKLPA